MLQQPAAVASLLSCDAVGRFMAILPTVKLSCGTVLPLAACTAAGSQRVLDLGAAKWLAAVACIAPEAQGVPALCGVCTTAAEVASGENPELETVPSLCYES